MALGGAQEIGNRPQRVHRLEGLEADAGGGDGGAGGGRAWGFVNQPGHAQCNDPAERWLQARPERAAAEWSCGLARPGGAAGDLMRT